MKQIQLLTFILLFLSNSLFAQADKNFTQANATLQKAIAKQGGSTILSQSSKYRLEGTRHFFGHYSIPEETKPIGDTVKVVFIPDIATSYYYSGISYYGKRSEITLNHKDSTYYMGYFADATEKGFKKERMLIYATSPLQMLQLALKYQKTLHWVGKNKTQEIIAFTDNIGEQFNLHIDKKSNLLMQVTQLVYDEQYGDTYNEVNYEYANLSDVRPTKLIKKEHGIVESEYRYADYKTDVVVDTNFVKYVCPSCKIEKTQPKADIAIEKIDNNLWIAKLNDLNNKALITEFKDYLAVMEAPNSAKVCSELIAAIKLKFPTKPIKLLALSHHHPDHAGGFVAFANQNIPIMTTKGNITFFEKLLKTKHTVVSENNPTTSKAIFKIVDAKSYQVVSDDENQFIAYESGETTDHVQEFLYFYFPKQKILFVGDLIIFPKEELRQQRKRAYSVYQLIKDKKLNVEKIYTAWPLKDQKEFGTLQDLKDSLKKNYPDLEKN